VSGVQPCGVCGACEDRNEALATIAPQRSSQDLR
jgi:hypothetical protein